MRDRALLPALAAALLLGGCASTPDAPEPPPVDAVAEVAAVVAAVSPIVDGVASEAAWTATPGVVVPVEGVSGPTSCVVRAAVHRGTLFLLVQWADASEDRDHEPWVDSGGGAWTTGTAREDVLSVAFPMEGEFTANMLSPVDATWDVWQWKAARTDPAGHAMDKVHRMTLADPGGRRAVFRLPDGNTVHVLRPEDAGDSVTEEFPRPSAGAPSPSPRYGTRRPTGSAASVVARGTWLEGTWTVELARSLRSVEEDDRDFHGLSSIPFALAILDRAEDGDHAVSGVLRLRLPTGEGVSALPPEGITIGLPQR